MARHAGWIVEHGIGETRAALICDGAILEAAIELPAGLRAGTVASGRLAELVSERIGLVILDGGGEALLHSLARGLTQGASLIVEVTREAIGHKRPLCRLARPESPLRDGPDLAGRIAATGVAVAIGEAHGDDTLEAAGWSEVLESAATGVIAFPGGSLLMSLTPAMTLFDVDGMLAPADLCVAGARAAGRAILRMEVAGSIGIDLPTVGDRGVRQAAAAALDQALVPPFERTAVNGFGFVQIVRPQLRASLPQMLAADPVGAAARALLRRAERTRGHGRRTLTAHPRVVARLEHEATWLAELERRIGAPIALRPSAGFAISAGHADAEHPG